MKHSIGMIAFASALLIGFSGCRSCCNKTESVGTIVYSSPAVAQSSAPSGALKLNDSTFRSEINGVPGVALVDFSTKWCGPCKKMEPVINAMAAEMSGTMKIAKVDCDESPDMSSAYKISGIPCLVLFKDGTEVARTWGYHSKEELTSWMATQLPQNTSAKQPVVASPEVVKN